MKIPNNYKKIMEKHMYDKIATIHSLITSEDEELNIITEIEEIPKETIKCNKKPTSKDLIKENYGLDIEAEYVLTCSDINSKIGDYLKLNGETFEIKSILDFDTHRKVFINGYKN